MKLCHRETGLEKRGPTRKQSDRKVIDLFDSDVEFGLEILGVHGCRVVDFVIGYVGARVAQLPRVFGTGNPLPRFRDDSLCGSLAA